MNMCMMYDDNNNVLALDKENDSYTGTTFPGGHVEKDEIFQDSIILILCRVFAFGLRVSPLTILARVDCLTPLIVDNLLMLIPRYLQSVLIRITYKSEYSMCINPHYLYYPCSGYYYGDEANELLDIFRFKTETQMDYMLSVLIIEIISAKNLRMFCFFFFISVQNIILHRRKSLLIRLGKMPENIR